MALSLAAGVYGSQEVDLRPGNKTPREDRIEYEEIFVAGQTIEKVIALDKRRDTDLQIVGNLTDTFTVWVTTTPGFDNTDILDPAVPWVESIPSQAAHLLSGGGAVNKGILAIKIVSVELTGDMEVSCSQSADDE